MLANQNHLEKILDKKAAHRAKKKKPKMKVSGKSVLKLKEIITNLELRN